jgi:hypothetical protein
MRKKILNKKNKNLKKKLRTGVKIDFENVFLQTS